MALSTSPPPKTERRLHLDAELTLTRDGATFDVWTEGDTLVLNAPSLAALRHVRAVERTLATVGLSGPLPDHAPPVDLRVRHATVGRFGEGVSPTPGVARVLGVGGRLSPRGVLAAAVRALG